MTIKNPQVLEQIEGLIKTLNQKLEEFHPVHQKYIALTENRTSLTKAAAAAEEQASQCRFELKSLLTQLMGKPSKQLTQKTAEQRSALELAEEYAALAESMSDDVIEADFDLRAAASCVRDAADKIRRCYADALLREAVAEVASRFKQGLAIQSRLENYRFNDKLALFDYNPDAYVMSELTLLIRNAVYSNQCVATGYPQHIADALNKGNIGQFPEVNHCEVHKHRCLKEYRKQQAEKAKAEAATKTKNKA